MNFVAQVEDHLRDLGAEARKAHPGKCVIFPGISFAFVQISSLCSLSTRYDVMLLTFRRCKRGIRESHNQPPLSPNAIRSSGPSF
jgi:hypothetical protein